MHLIALETSSSRGGLALLRDRELAGDAPLSEGLVHGREVTVQLDRLLSRLGLAPGRLDAVAVSAGPGSYTGIRVGVTVAKTLAFALRIALVPVSSLSVIAANALRVESGEALTDGASLGVLLDGKQGHIYRAVFRRRGERLERAVADGVVHSRTLADGVLADVPPGAMLIGDAADLALERLGGADRSPSGYRRGPAAWDWPRASALALLALERYDAGDALVDPEAIHGLEPVYLRVSEAERRLARGAVAAGAPEGG